MTSLHNMMRKYLEQQKLTKQSNLYYVIYSPAVKFSDIPSLGIEDQSIIAILKDRAALYGTLVINITETVLSLHYSRVTGVSEWGKIYLPSPSHRGGYNQELGQTLPRQSERLSNRPVIRTEYKAGGGIKLVF